MVCDRPLIALFPITRAPPLRRAKNNHNTKHQITIVIPPAIILYRLGYTYVLFTCGGGKSKQRARLLDRQTAAKVTDRYRAKGTSSSFILYGIHIISFALFYSRSFSLAISLSLFLSHSLLKIYLYKLQVVLQLLYIYIFYLSTCYCVIPYELGEKIKSIKYKISRYSFSTSSSSDDKLVFHGIVATTYQIQTKKKLQHKY